MRVSIEARLSKYTIPVTESGCLLWIGATGAGGYGIMSLAGRHEKAHRASFINAGNTIPEGMCVLHKCDTPCCVRPDHLMLGTQQENIADMIGKGRMRNPGVPGVAHWNSKLSSGHVLAIRRDPRTQRVIAAEYGISQGHVSGIKRMKKRAKAIKDLAPDADLSAYTGKPSTTYTIRESK